MTTSPDLSALPDEIKSARRFLLWKYVTTEPGTKPRKVPCYINGKPRGKTDTAQDVAQFATLDAALAVFNASKGYAGIGFALGEDKSLGGYWQGIDLDGLDTRPDLNKMVPLLPGYVETSPSRKGVHALGFGPKFDNMEANPSGIEAYCEKRYFTITGDKKFDYAMPITDLSEFVDGTLRPVHGSVERPRAASTQDPLMAYKAPHGVTLAEAAEMLTHLDPNMSRAQWFSVACALHYEFDADPDAFHVWDEWSQGGDTYGVGQTPEAVWASIQREGTGDGPVVTFATIKKMVKDAQPVAVEDVPATFVKNAAEFVRAVKSPHFLVENVLQHGYVYSCTAKWGHGKTAVWLTLAVHIAMGAAFAGLRVERCRTLFCAGENPDDVRMRCLAICDHYGFDMEEVAKWLFFTERAFFITDTAERDRHVAAIKEAGDFGVAMIDTLPAHSSTDDENANTQQIVVAKAVRKFGLAIGNPAVVAMMHPTQSATKATLRSRGGGAFAGEIDGELLMWNENGVVDLWHSTKFRGPGFKTRSFALKKVGVPGFDDNFGNTASSVVAVESDPLAEQAAKLDLKGRSLDVYKAFVRALDELGPADLDGIVTKEAWEAQFLATEKLVNFVRNEGESDGDFSDRWKKSCPNLVRTFQRGVEKLVEMGVFFDVGPDNNRTRFSTSVGAVSL
jgi:hypothetical protein